MVNLLQVVKRTNTRLFPQQDSETDNQTLGGVNHAGVSELLIKDTLDAPPAIVAYSLALLQRRPIVDSRGGSRPPVYLAASNENAHRWRIADKSLAPDFACAVNMRRFVVYVIIAVSTDCCTPCVDRARIVPGTVCDHGRSFF